MVYLDNAATTFPKPPCVAAAMHRFMTEIGANPGRAAHRLAVEAGHVVGDARESVARLFGVPDPLRVVFTLNATEAINVVVHGMLNPGDHVVTSGMEHNAVMRPLRMAENRGVTVSVVPCACDGQLDPDDVARSVRSETRLIIMTHASNVTGTILPVAEVAEIARARDVLFAVDAAQTAGSVPIDLADVPIDFFVFSGHKGLYGPHGTGGMVIGDRVDPAAVRPLKTGGTGSRSAHADQPDFLPDRFESGTPNAPGLAGLGSAVRYLLDVGVENIRDHERGLLQLLLDGLAHTENVTIHGPGRAETTTATVSFTIDGVSASDAALRLDDEFDVLCRVGLQCAPCAHRTMDTFPDGTIRFGLGYFNTASDINRGLEGVACLAAK